MTRVARFDLGAVPVTVSLSGFAGMHTHAYAQRDIVAPVGLGQRGA